MNEILNSWTEFTETPHYEITFKKKKTMSFAVKWFHAYKEKGRDRRKDSSVNRRSA
jgi:hypothetical protein